MLELKKFRKKQNLTQKELAQRLNVCPNTISQYETGDREPNLSVLKRMSNVLKCSLDELVV